MLLSLGITYHRHPSNQKPLLPVWNKILATENNVHTLPKHPEEKDKIHIVSPLDIWVKWSVMNNILNQTKQHTLHCRVFAVYCIVQ